MGLPVLLRLCNLSGPWQRLYSLVEELSRSKPACTTISPHLISSLSAKFSWPHVLVLQPYTLQIVESTVNAPSASVTWRLRSDKAGCCVDLWVLQTFGSVFTWHGSLSISWLYLPWANTFWVNSCIRRGTFLLSVSCRCWIQNIPCWSVLTHPDFQNICTCSW